MRIQLSRDMKIEEVQVQFNELFPFLRLGFFRNRQRVKHPETEKPLPFFTRFREIQPLIINGDIEIDSKMTVKELENKFAKDFLIYTQVFRRSGNIWLETTMTDDWSLYEQNEHGKDITIHNAPAEKDDEDYELKRDANS